MPYLIGCIVSEESVDAQLVTRVRLTEVNGNQHHVNAVASLNQQLEVGSNNATMLYLTTRYTKEYLMGVVGQTLQLRIRCEDF